MEITEIDITKQVKTLLRKAIPKKHNYRYEAIEKVLYVIELSDDKYKSYMKAIVSGKEVIVSSRCALLDYLNTIKIEQKPKIKFSDEQLQTLLSSNDFIVENLGKV